MALVSNADVVAHQLITAGPRGTRAQRADTRIARMAAHRELAVRKAATSVALAELDEAGQARLVYRPGTVSLRRDWTGRRRRLVAIPVPSQGDLLAAEAEQFLRGEDTARFLDALAEEMYGSGDSGTAPCPLGTARTSVEGLGGEAGSVASGTAVPETDEQRFERFLRRVKTAIHDGELPFEPSRKEVRDMLGCRTQLAGEVRKALFDGRDDGAAGVPAAA